MPSIHIPAELTSLRQWVLWRYEDRGGPKRTKTPTTAMGYRASVTNPEHWSEYSYLTDLLCRRPDFASGVGFVFTPEDPYTGIDLDNVWPSDAAETPRWAEGILERFADTYSEESPSGTGVKIWCRAKAPRSGTWKVEGGAIEIYDHSRFFTVTGKSAGVAIITDHQADIEELVANLEGDKQGQRSPRIETTIPYGTQHNTLVSLAGTMHRRGVSAEAIEAALLVVNAQQCEKPGPEENIRRIIASMAKWRK